MILIHIARSYKGYLPSIYTNIIRKPQNYLPVYKINPFVREHLPWDLYDPNQIENTTDGKWSTEHVTPRSLLLKYAPDSVNDLYNLFNTSPIINSHRSNFKFTQCVTLQGFKTLAVCGKTGGVKPAEIIDTYTYNYKNNKKRIWLPTEKSRGPIARSVAYMLTTYNDLESRDIIDMDILKRWHKMYPPEIWEIHHMWKIFSVQGNINPFIIYPDSLDDMIFPTNY